MLNPVNDLKDRLQAALGDAYRVERELARGGMSRLFLANEVSLNRQVVVKLLPPEMASEVSAARFKQEIEVVAQLQHPHVLPVHAAGSRDDLIYYVMPYVEGESLRHRLNQQGRLPIEEASLILTEVADALAFAHDRGVVHRDIKPENILLQQGHAVLTDFGVARAVEEARGEARLTEVGMAVGTPGYMSPEQASGETNLDARSDLYALAVVGYEVLVGEQPFTGPNAQAVLAAHLTEEAAPVSERRPGVPAQLDAAIARALAKAPAERFQTAAAFRDALRLSIATSAPVPTQRMPSRRTVYAAMAAVAFAASIASFLLWPRGWTLEGDARKSLIVFPFENRTNNPESDYLQEASMNLLGLAVAHWEDMRVYDDERTSSLMRRRSIESPADIDFDAAQAMAKDANVGTFIMGDIRREGDSLAFEAKVHDVASGDRLATEIVRAGLSADPRPLFDSLAVLILQISGAPPGERPDLLAETTQSLEAYREYLVGSEAMQLLEIDSARAHLERAIELDSTFALAYMRLVNVDGWTLLEQNPQSRRENVAKAMAHSQNLPVRYRLLLQFHSAYQAGQFQRAREIAQQMIARDSTDAEAWYQSGEAHFHNEPDRFPHSDTLGNYGKALNAFQKTLALDSGYVLAYLHIVDTWGSCAADAPWLCVADSAVYATRDELDRMFGAATVERERRHARAARLAAAYAWVDAAPTSVRARTALLSLLLERELYADAQTQIDMLEAEGHHGAAASGRARIHYAHAEYAAAAAEMKEAVELEGGVRALVSNQIINEPIVALSGGALFDDATVFFSTIIQLIPDDAPVRGPGSIQYAKDHIIQLLELQLLAQAGSQPELLSRSVHAWLDTLDGAFEPGSTEHRNVWTALGSTVLASYTATSDTTLLARFISRADTSSSRTWRTMLAHLALARGDTTRARAGLNSHYDSRDSLELSGDAGTVRLFAWANLMARIGDLERAVDAYARFDSDVRPGSWPGLHVRSWAERGALYQELGDRDSAIEMYQKFIAAWEPGDDSVQGLVDRARAAVAALKGVLADEERGRR
ncbi:MAG: protein kinase [Gemmatimonadota bacterium]|nr:MAG: protein kinase [Gemmatimonadota bacterium]